MKKILTILFIMLTVNLYAWPFSKKEPEKVCHYALIVSDTGPKVIYLYKTPCVNIELVGIISEPENKIIHVDNMNLALTVEYKSIDERLNYLEKNFPNISKLPFYIAPK